MDRPRLVKWLYLLLFPQNSCVLLESVCVLGSPSELILKTIY